MNAYDLIRKFILETEKAFYTAKGEGNLWKAEGLRRLHISLLNVKDRF